MLSAPRPEKRAPQLRRLVRRLCATLRQERATADQLASQLRQTLERVRQLEAEPRQIGPQEVIVIGERPFSARHIAKITDTPLTTLRRQLTQIEEA